MSANRNDILATLARGMRKFDGFSAGQLLSTGWSGLSGLCEKDIKYFMKHAEKPFEEVARGCQGRSSARSIDPLVSKQ